MGLKDSFKTIHTISVPGSPLLGGVGVGEEVTTQGIMLSSSPLPPPWPTHFSPTFSAFAAQSINCLILIIHFNF